MYWNGKRSVLTHKNKDFKYGDEIPAAVLATMGKPRVEKLVKDGLLADKAPKKSDEKKVDPEEKKRLALLDQAKMMGLKPHHNTGIEKLEEMIDAENKRLELLVKAKDMKLDVEENAKIEDLEKAIDAANGPN
jgi:hypothetical protein